MRFMIIPLMRIVLVSNPACGRKGNEEMSIKTEYKYIKFDWIGGPKDRKTWKCTNIKGNYALGIICWYSMWKRYCFFPIGSTVYSQDCLEDIIHFMKQLPAGEKR